MKNVRKVLGKVTAIFLSVAILIGTMPAMGVFAEKVDTTFVKVSDPSTLDDWKKFFGTSTKNTENAGGVWMDKSVFADADALGELTDAYDEKITPTVDESSFLVALSALASNKSIVGYSHIPTDTVLVLDISGSMEGDATENMVLAANAAITELLALNNHNRVGVAIYSAEYNEGNEEHSYTLLPIDRYSATETVTYNNGTPNDTSDDKVVGKYLIEKVITETVQNNRPGRPGNNGGDGGRQVDYPGISLASGVKTSDKTDAQIVEAKVAGGTFIQSGLDRAADMFKAISDANDTVITQEGFQSGAQRKPVYVLMSDGAPTYSTTNYMNVTDHNRGNGSSSTAANAFLTQLTASYVKEKATDYYNGSEALFYTLGLGISSDNNAVSTLNPDNSTETIKGWWEDYLEASNGANVTLDNWQSDFTVVRSSEVTSMSYVDQFFKADTANDLFKAFQAIVNQIIIQSLYRPTLVEESGADMSGYIEFIDDVGEWMKVQEIEGIMIGDKLYTGEYLCESFSDDGAALGTVENPSDLGNNFIWAVKERLGIESTEKARELVELAYSHGQLSYDAETGEFSNYIGWYADKDGKFIGFWDESHTYEKMPDNAVYVNKSYGMLGEIADGYSVSDLMYVSIQVHTEIADPQSAGALETDIIVPGHCQLIYRVPASLIPVVSYSISLEGTSYEDATNIEMEIEDAEPIRLLFEVGLRDDINELNVSEVLGNEYLVTDVNDPDYGKYRLYTNEWSQQQFENSVTGTVHPSEAINTVAYFEPNHSNERYYYNEPTPIYILDSSTGEYKLYNSSTKPAVGDGNHYFRQLRIFERTENLLDGNAAELKKDQYERISDTVIKDYVEAGSKEGEWNVKKDTIHRVYDSYNIKKTKNETKTIEYSDYSSVEYSDTHYYADTILGNNGLLTITPATGIKLTKTVDASLTGTTEAFTFNVNVAGASGSYDIVRESADGTQTSGETVTFDSNGDAKITLSAGESVYILNLPIGTYTVTEDVTGKNYEVKSVNGIAGAISATGTIEEYKLAEAQFENTLKNDGYLVISKEVTHPFANDPAGLSDKTFKFDVTLTKGTEDYPESQVNVIYSNNNTEQLPVSNNKITGIELKDSQSVALKLEEGWIANVEEVNLADYSGFSLDTDNSVFPENDSQKTISTDTNVEYDFVNKYTPATVSPVIDLDVSKTLTGRDWKDGEEFTFVLSRYNPATAEYEEIKTETVGKPASGNTAELGDVLSQFLKNEVYDKEGAYHYQISEVVPAVTAGVTYDKLAKFFNVIVSDNDMDGKLDYTVENVNHTQVTGDITNGYNVSTTFTNVYKADGIAEVIIDIKKTVDSSTGEVYNLEGFEFGFYDKTTGELIGQTDTTDADGKAVFVFTYTADGVTPTTPKVYEYVLKETNSGIAGMNYAQDVNVKITVEDNLDGTIRATTDIQKFTQETNMPLIEVTNVYNPDSAEVTIEGTKSYVDHKADGITLESGAFKFLLTEVDSQFQSISNPKVYNASNNQNGNFKFELEFDKVGKYYFLLTEKDEGKTGVHYDNTAYEVTIDVTDDGSGTLQHSVEIKEQGGTRTSPEFENIYAPDAVFVELGGTKKLNGRNIVDGEFSFALYNANDLTDDIETVKNSGDKFKFTKLEFKAKGDYEYVIKEVKGTDDNITYDETEYKVKIKVIDTNGVLSYEVYLDGVKDKALEITNTHTPDPIYVELGGTKKLNGRNIVDGEFSFALYNANDLTDDIETVKNSGDKFKFTKLEFKAKGDYEYVIKEVKGTDDNITYDETEYKVKVKVIDTNGVLSYEVYLDGVKDKALEITNTHTPDPIYVELCGTKKLNGRNIVDGEFSFTLYDAEGKEIETVKNVGGNFNFKALAYAGVGDYEYTVKEVKGTDDNITYDTNEYKVTVKVTDTNGVLSYKVYVGEEESGEIKFTNTYTPDAPPTVPNPDPDPEPTPTPEPEPEPQAPTEPETEAPADTTESEDAAEDALPKTDDVSNPALWVALLFVSSGGIIGISVYNKKRSKE